MLFERDYSVRDYLHIDGYLDKLQEEIYPQPEDEGHTSFAKEAIDWMFNQIGKKYASFQTENASVLDVGCGVGFCQKFFAERGMTWNGITLGYDDYVTGRSNNKEIYLQDMSFLKFKKDSFDLIFARHILEHSPMPLLTLMEWHRVSRKFAYIVLPSPEYWGHCGKNHYYVLEKQNWECLFESSDWKISDQKELHMSDPVFYSQWLPKYDDNFKQNELKEKGDKVVEFWYLLEKR